jgi:signal transduction histidine kinase
MLVGIRLQLAVVAGRLEKSELKNAISDVEKLLEEALSATRDLAIEPSPPVLYDTGLTAALESQARRLERQNRFQVEVESHVPEKRMREEYRVLLYDCVRELLLNAVKHSGTDSARVALKEDSNNFVKVIVQDHGRGFSVEKVGIAIGIGVGLFIRETGLIDFKSRPR